MSVGSTRKRDYQANRARGWIAGKNGCDGFRGEVRLKQGRTQCAESILESLCPQYRRQHPPQVSAQYELLC